MTSTPWLTIAIPTYNRNELLLFHLGHLLPQLDKGCRLLICDNCSPVPVQETLAPLLREFPDVEVQLIRNRVNIGANANILRCIEMCETPYIWMMGDDDRPLPAAIQTIFATIEEFPDCLYYNFGFDGLRKETFVTRGLEEFADKLDASANVPWISSAVCHAPTMQPQLKLGYQYAYSMLPHVAVLLMSIGEEGRCCSSKEMIVDVVNLGEENMDHAWSRVDFALGSPVLFDLPLGSKVRRQIARKLLTTNYGDSIKMRMWLHQLMVQALRSDDKETASYLYHQIRHRTYYFEKRPARRAALALGWFVVRFPKLTARVYRLLKKKELVNERLQDRYERI